MCPTTLLDTIGHMSEDFVGHVSDRTLVSDFPLLPLGRVCEANLHQGYKPSAIGAILAQTYGSV